MLAYFLAVRPQLGSELLSLYHNIVGNADGSLAGFFDVLGSPLARIYDRQRC